MFVRGTAVATL
jgi:uncharacterized membrane protein YtjA (UPF0391 family)